LFLVRVEAAGVIPVYVAVQKQYCEDWLKSVGVVREKQEGKNLSRLRLGFAKPEALF
jgi:hypothetical protein